ncbi:hypothetical protein VP501E541_P0036 [Vibrio phage 501E54-1]|nr:hypothetical protein VP501E541_P0036 [Vibrio phage 501E54-1]
MPYTPQEVVADVRFYIGEVSCDFLDDQSIYEIMVRQEADTTRPDSAKCKVTFATIKETLRYLIRNYQSMISGSDPSVVSTGDIAEIEEVIGKRKKRIKYNTSGSSSSASSDNWKTHWKELLEYYELTGITAIGCETTAVTDPTVTTTQGVVKIGVSKSAYDTASPWRQSLYKTRKTWPNPYE